MTRRSTWLRWAVATAAVLIGLGAITLAIVWWKFWQSADQTELATPEDRFKYGSLGGELVAGIPYPIFMILPRVFPDLVEKYATEGFGPAKAGYGGWGAFGLAWEEGQRLPIGFSIKRLGYERVTINCAICHTTVYRFHEGDLPSFAVGGPGQTVNLRGIIRFLIAASHDRRFTAARLMPEMALNFKFDPLDWAIYSFILIPQTRLALRLAEDQLRWMDSKPAWAPGEDDAFNLPKYILTQSPWDDTVGTTDFPGVWRLAERDGHLLHSAGEARSVYPVVATSAIGIGSLPVGDFEERNRWIEAFLRTLEPPPFPLPIDKTLAERGAALFAEHCGACHAKGGARLGTAIPIEEIGTDPEHVRTWRQNNAERMNVVTRLLGARHAEMEAAQGYVARPLTGAWLLGPYLHNGSVPTLRDLLSPASGRPTVFYRGLDLLDAEQLGYVSTGPAAAAKGFRFDTTLKGNGNAGHEYGTTLPEADKRALIEFMKTL
jgi:mono/diheme cytochrome c family protein